MTRETFILYTNKHFIYIIRTLSITLMGKIYTEHKRQNNC